MVDIDKLHRERKLFTTSVNTKYGKISYNKNEDGIGGVLSTGVHWDADIIDNYLKSIVEKSNVILDIGAHIGCHSIAYAKINPQAIILAFEMQAEMYHYLKINLEDNNITNVKPYCNAVGNCEGEFETEIKLRDGGYYKPVQYFTNDKFNFGGLGLGIGGAKVKMIRIDDLHFDRCDFIKIDVEGFEYGVLLGAIETIKKYKPIIFYEYADKYMTPEMCNIANIPYDEYNPKSILLDLGYNEFNTSIKGNVIASYKLIG